jgi:hypothetical protein
MVVVLVVGLAGSAEALRLKVDIAYPKVSEDPVYIERHNATSKSGWFIWSAPRWKDMWRHDAVWAGTNVDGPLPEGMNGTGINAQLRSVVQEGHSRLWVNGLTTTGDGAFPEGTVEAEPLANSFMTVYQLDQYDSVLLLRGVPAGMYYFISYHNDPNAENPEGSPADMASIQITGPSVTARQNAYNVPVQHESSDANLVPAMTWFRTTGANDVEIRFERGSGGRPVLNAFILTTGLGTAMDPIPDDKAEDVCPGVPLCWTPGGEQAQHDVYLGTNWDDVNDATTSSAEIFMGSLARDVNCYEPAGLELSKTYYWRVDEVNSLNPDSPWKGDVWEFTTNDGNAFDLYPPDSEIRVPLEVVLSWEPGCEAASHDVYIGTDAVAVENATSSSHPDVEYANVGVPEYDPLADANLEYRTNYYWRVDEVKGPTIWRGDVQTFRTRSLVSDPNLRLWYPLDEEPPSEIVEDWSGNEFTGNLGDPNALDPTGGRFGGCMTGSKVTVPIPAVETITDAISISFWLKDITVESGHGVFDTKLATDVRVAVAVPGDDASDVRWQAGNDSNDMLHWNIGIDLTTLEDWHHWVFIKDEPCDVMKIYMDADEVASKTGVADYLQLMKNNQAEIGGWVGGGGSALRSNLDDFRLYDRVLLTSEIEELFRGGDVGRAWLPTPRDRETDVSRDVSLIWKPGDYAEWHDVYFGTIFDDVNDANTSSDVYKGSQVRDANTYDLPGVLDLGQTYFWRIDEVNVAEVNSPWKGKVWQFTAASFLIVDDMEAYDDDVPVPQNPINGTWLDGWWNYTGSTVYLEYGPGAAVHGGGKAMWLEYVDDGFWGVYYSEVHGNTATGNHIGFQKDWTDGGVRALTLFFYGDPCNTVEPLFVGLEDTPKHQYISYYGAYAGQDNNDMAEAEWHQWDMALSDFWDGSGVDINDVNKILIGTGDRDDIVVGGTGNLYIDDIRLYLPRCVPDLAKPDYDFSGNCIVDMADIRVMADEWLRSDAYLSVVPPPSPPVGWWKLDGDATDSSASGYNGAAEGSYGWESGHIDQAIEFTGDGGRVLVADDGNTPLLRPADQISVTTWARYSVAPPHSARAVAKGVDQGDHENFALQISGDGAGWFVRDSNTVLHGAGGARLYRDEWAHIAGTYDGNSVSCYLNGQLTGSETIGVVTLLQDSNALSIGDAVDVERELIGSIDDVRVYNYGLSAENVAYIATQSTGGAGTAYMPLLSEMNKKLYDKEGQGQKAVNFRDYAEIFTAWLEEVLWP